MLQLNRLRVTLASVIAAPIERPSHFYYPMKISRSVRTSAVSALFFFSLVASIQLFAAQPREEVMIDFTTVSRDPNGTVNRSYEYAFGDWGKHIVDLQGRGTLIKAPTGKGGMGENKTMVEFGKFPVVDLQFVIGNANKAQALSFSLEDRDGTEQTWAISIAGKPRGQLLRQRFDLRTPDHEQKPGKTPGMNLKKVLTWQVRGDWTDPNVEVLLVKLTAEK